MLYYGCKSTKSHNELCYVFVDLEFVEKFVSAFVDILLVQEFVSAFLVAMLPQTHNDLGI